MREGDEVARPGIPREVFRLAKVGIGPHVPGPVHPRQHPVDLDREVRLLPALSTRLMKGKDSVC